MITAAEPKSEETYSFSHGNLPTKKLKASHAFIGDVVIFKRKGCFIQGTVISYRTETVIVEVESSISRQFDFTNNLTVVNHKNYEIR